MLKLNLLPDTAKSVEYIKEKGDKSFAAIASKEASEII